MNKETIINSKRRILNIALLFICFMIFSFIGSNVQAVSLKFEGNITEDSGDGEYIYINTITTPSVEEDYVNSIGYGKWDTNVSMNSGGGESSWDSYAMVFHKDNLSKNGYENEPTGKDIKVRYDTYSGYLRIIEISDLDPGTTLNLTFGSKAVNNNITHRLDMSTIEKIDNLAESREIAVSKFESNIARNDSGYLTQNVYIDRRMFIKTADTKNGIAQVTRWAIKKSFLKDTIFTNDKLYSKETIDGKAYYKTMFSEMARTKSEYAKKEWNNAAEGYNALVSTYDSSTGGVYWGADMHGILPKNDITGGYTLSDNRDALHTTALLNVFDNYLYVPMEIFGKKYTVEFIKEDITGKTSKAANSITGTFSLNKDGTLIDQDGNEFGENITIPKLDGYVFNKIGYTTSQQELNWKDWYSKLNYNFNSFKTLRENIQENYNNINDNTLIVVKLKQEPPKTVLVRHLVQDSEGNYSILDSKLTNLNQTLTDSWDNNTKKIVPNGYRKIKVSVPSGYSESYVVGLRDKILIDKSRTVMYENATYNYQGYRVGYDNVLGNAMKNRDDATTSPKSQVYVTGNSKYYCIDFYYTKTTPTNPDKPGEDPDTPNNDTGIIPKLDVDPKKDGNNLNSVSEGANGTCKVAYVPAGEQIKPYVETPTYKPYTLVYNLVGFDNDGKNKYDIYTYDTYKLTGARVDNSTADESTRYFSSNSQNGVVNGNGSVGLSYNVDINSKITASRDELRTKSPLNTVTVKSGDNVKKDEYTTVLDVPSNKYNGLREPIGRATYDVVSVVANGKNSNLGKVAGKATATVTALNNTKINVYTPLVLGNAEIKSENSVNHSNKDQGIIQKNTQFTLMPKIKANASGGYNSDLIKDTEKYLKYYYVIFDFDIQLTNGQIKKAGEKIKVSKGGSITATPTSGFDESSSDKTDTVSAAGNHIKIIGVTYNMPEGNFEGSVLNLISVTSTTDKYVDNNQISKVEYTCDGNKTKNHTDLGLNMSQDAKYFAQKRQDVINIGRIYDFEVTDCLDVNFKNVFRNINSTTGEVNSITGTVYFSGIKQLRIYGNGNNVTTDRTNINKVPSKLILPLGPYKHTESNYVQAPKLGYRISFDLKTSGKYAKGGSNNRYIDIKPSYYYVSKDGNTFNDNIELYYKTSSGKYVQFAGSGYTIYFKPNDGYRNGTTVESTGNISSMSSKLEPLRIGSNSFKLTDNMMSTSDDNYIQSWYGEFKLPNSTLALPKGETDLNKALANGYIGVKFDITCVDSLNDVRVSYNQNDKSTGKGNTSQWDYEGYMGFSTPGSDMPNNSLGLQFENGTWKIANNDIYNRIKGTVALFDTDNRAANDFE
ncbi:MAG: hypothetical protein PHP54_03420 [Clostridia bacterium]|nr:hypothetical protein [Clostridia bacterium]